MNTCSVDGCEVKTIARGLCRAHYSKAWARGLPSLPAKQIVEKKCEIEGCNSIFRVGTDGLCKKHHIRKLRYGNPLSGNTPYGEPQKWILDHINYTDEKCLIWPYVDNGNGYGILTIDGRKEYAHVVMCTITNGPKPSNSYETAHSCGVNSCVSPLHLRWATCSENNADKIKHGTHCRGERQVRSRLKSQDVIEITQLMSSGLKNRELSERYCVSTSTIENIRRGLNWGWLTGIKP